MKLVLAIVQDDDAIDLIEELTDKDNRVKFVYWYSSYFLKNFLCLQKNARTRLNVYYNHLQFLLYHLRQNKIHAEPQ